jgi:hypothetical protein
MSSLTVVGASQRFDRVAFNPAVEHTDHVVEVGAYRCPHCETEIQFTTGTLRQFERSKGLALGLEWHQRCESIRPIGPWEWSVDFRCRGCTRHVRIVYGHDGEYAMGAWKYRLLDVIEEHSDTRAV